MATLHEQHFIPTAEAARLSGYNPDYLSRLCRSGALIAKRAGRSWRVDRRSLERFMKQQEKRKNELAVRTSREREREYRQAAAIRRGVNPQAAKSQRMAFSVIQVIRVCTTSVSVLRSPYAALGISALALAGGVILAGSGVIERSGSLVLNTALTARAASIEQLSTVTIAGVERRQKIRERGVAPDAVFAQAQAKTLHSAANKTAQLLDNSSPALPMVRDAYASAATVRSSLPTPRPAAELIDAAVAFTNPAHVRSALLTLYARTGEVLYTEGEALGAWYLRTLEDSGTALAILGEQTRDEMRYSTALVANTAQTFSTAVITTHEKLVFGFVYGAQATPEAIFGTLYAVGDSTGNFIAQGIANAPEHTQSLAIESFGVFQGLSNRIESRGYLLGLGARRVTETALAIQEIYVREVVARVHDLVHTNNVYAQAAKRGNSMKASVFSFYQFADRED